MPWKEGTEVNVKFYPNHSGIRALSLPSGIVGSAVRRAGERTAERARMAVTRSGRVRTGAMRAGIRTGQFRVTGEAVTQQVGGSETYTVFQDQGTRHIRGARFFETALRQLTAGDFRAT